MTNKYKKIFSFFVFSGMILLSQGQQQVRIFVSPAGDDRNSGTVEAPLQTLYKAREMSRTIDARAIEIVLREGTYRLAEPVVFTPEDTKNGKSLLITAYSAGNAPAITMEKVIIKGSVQLPSLSWKPYKQGIWQAVLPDRISQMDMLFVNDEYRHMARFPNFDSTASRFNGTSANATAPERVKGWKNPVGGYLHAMHAYDWGDFHYRITGKDTAGNLALEGGWQNNRQNGMHPEFRMVENIFEELDCPGEWYYQPDTRILYYYPLPNENIFEATFETPILNHLIIMKGMADNPVKNITIRGITLSRTCRTFMEKYEPLLRSDWTVYRGGAVCFERTENCRLEQCALSYIGGNAVFFNGYNRNSGIVSTEIKYTGASGVCFAGDPSAARSPCFEYGETLPVSRIDFTRGPKNDNYPDSCFVENCHIHHVGMTEKQVAGINLSMCHAIHLIHNSIYHTPRAGINICDGTWGGHYIHGNDVFNTVRETGDHGSFNSWGRDRYWRAHRQALDSLLEDTSYQKLIPLDAIDYITLSYNRFRCDRGWDIDLDDGASNYFIHHNLCANGGLKLREGFNRVVENNILINNTLHIHVWFKEHGTVFKNNLVTRPYEIIGKNSSGENIDYNFFTDSISSRVALENGTDRHSVVIQTFDTCTRGEVRSLLSLFDMHVGCSPSAGTFPMLVPDLPEKPLLRILSHQEKSTIVLWDGLKIKSLETLGERSATGMDSERGVLVLAVPAFNSQLRDYFRANDVILGINGTPVQNLQDLQNLFNTIKLSDTVVFDLYRDQRKQQIQIPGEIVKKTR
ncbi:MAG: PDZ domain-containing protein [Bacteroidales bacterium]|nr:PDZ domain-containing protein [Bacteroidales bacterium]